MLLLDLARLLEQHLEISGAYPHSTRYAINRLYELIRENPNAALPSVREPLLGSERDLEVRRSQGQGLPETGG